MRTTILIAFLIILSSAKGQPPRLMVPNKHVASIVGAAISPDNRFIATITSDNMAALWEARSGKELYIMTDSIGDRGQEGEYNSVLFSADNNYILVYNKTDATPVIHRVIDGQIVARLGPYTSCAAFSHDGTYVATGNRNGEINIYKTSTGERTHTFDTFKVDISKYDANIGRNLKTEFNGKHIDTAKAHQQIVKMVSGLFGAIGSADRALRIQSICFSPDDRRILTSSENKTVKIFDINSGRATIFTGHTDNVNDAEFSPDGKYIVSISDDRTARVWESMSGKSVLKINTHYPGARAMFNPAGNSDVAGGRDILTVPKSIANSPAWYPIVWSSRGKQLKTFNSPDIETAFFGKNGKYAVTLTNASVKLWNMEAGNFSLTQAMDIGPLCFSNDGKYLAGFRDDKLGFWKIQPTEKVADMEELNGSLDIYSLKIGEKVIFKEPEQANVAKNGEKEKRVERYNFNINTSPDGKYKTEVDSTGTDNNFSLMLDSLPMKIVRSVDGHVVAKFFTSIIVDRVVFTPDSKFLVVSRLQSGVTKIIELSTGKLMYVIKGVLPLRIAADYNNDNTQSPPFTPNGKYLIVQSTEQRYNDLARGVNYSLPEVKSLQDLMKMATASLVMIDLSTGKEKSELGKVSQLGFEHIYSPPTLTDPKGGKYMVVLNGLFINTCDLYNTSTGKLIASLKGHNNMVKAVKFSDDGKYILTDAGENIFKLWSIATGKLLLNYIPVTDSTYMQITPEGYYTAPREAIKSVYYVTNDLKVITFDQLDVKYNRPDKVLQSLGNDDRLLIDAYKQAYQMRIKHLGLDTTAFNKNIDLPDLEIVNRDDIDAKQINPQVKIHVKATDPGTVLDRFNVWVNRVPVFGIQGISLRRYHKKSIDTNISITLSIGVNNIEASVTNSNAAESYREPLKLNYQPANAKTSHLYFIGLAVDHFADASENLSYSVNDIRALARGFALHYHQNITIDTLFDKNITLGNITRIKQKLRALTVNDKVILAYSGHGMVSNGDYYFSTYYTDFTHPEKNGLAYADLEYLLTDINPRKKLMLIDACQSGGGDKDELNQNKAKKVQSSQAKASRNKAIKAALNNNLKLENNFDLMRFLFANVEKSNGATVIASSTANGLTTYRTDLKHGIFTYSILETLNDYDQSKLSELSGAGSDNPYKSWTVNALMEYISKRVRQLSGSYEQPVMRSENFEADWDIWN